MWYVYAWKVFWTVYCVLQFSRTLLAGYVMVILEWQLNKKSCVMR